jgi:hypothetical protein
MVVTLVQLSGCRKIIDKLFPGHENDDKTCRIKSIKQFITAKTYRTGLFYYNDHGDPDSVIFDVSTGSAGPQLYYFKYNQHNKLIEYRADYDRDPGNYFTIHNYSYAGGHIVTDKARVRQAGSYKTVSKLEYDSQGRVIKENVEVVETDGQPTSEILDPLIYTYNADGNLVLSYISAYDNKTSYLSTNDVWMFIERNYSKNNPVGATQYNDADLPLGFNNTAGGFFLQFGQPSEIRYHCR